MKLKTYVFIASIALLEMAAGTKDGNPIEGVLPGDLAPEIVVQKGNQCNELIKFKNSEGYYTFINFWAAYDAESRVNNIQFWKDLQEVGSERLRMYSISLDSKESVFQSTIDIDQLTHTQQFWSQNVIYTDVFGKYSKNKDVKNILVDNNGLIIKRDLQPEQFRSFLKSI